MKSLRRLFTVALGVALLVVGWLFADANGQQVSVSLVFGPPRELRLWEVMVGSFAAGAFAAGALAALKLAQLSLVSRRYRRAVRGLETEVERLRNLPLAPEPLTGAPARGSREGAAAASAARVGTPG